MDNNKDIKDIKSSLVLHIPHSSINIPSRENYIISDTDLDKEILKLSDLGSDLLFDLGNTVDKLVFLFNRLYCDVERLPDKDEELFKYGRGFYYTKTDCGKELRGLKDKQRIKRIYNKHHKTFTKLVKSKLDKNGLCTIIDCHTFSNIPFDTDLDKNENRPDICLGTSRFHTPSSLVNKIQNGFESLGFSVKINSPYSGTIVPLQYYHKDNRVQSIMIEINRKLFIKDNYLDYQKIITLNKYIKNILLSL